MDDIDDGVSISCQTPSEPAACSSMSDLTTRLMTSEEPDESLPLLKVIPITRPKQILQEAGIKGKEGSSQRARLHDSMRG